MPKKNKFMNRGAAILSICFALFFFVILGRFAFIQATGKVNGEVLAVKAKEQYEKKRTIEAHRGSILDQNGKVLAEDTSTYKVVAILDKNMTVDKKHPQHVVNKEETAKKLAPILGMDEGEMLDILNKKGFQVEFGAAGRDISYSQKEKIEKLNLPGIAFIRDTKRYYPNGIFASNLIGYSQINEKTKEMQGMMGLEKTLNSYLKETDGYMSYDTDRTGWRLPNSGEKVKAPDNGDNVYLTIDQKIQAFLEDSMTTVQKEYQPKKIMAAVVDPKTGKVLAMGQRPSFDPNKRDVTNYYNDLISYSFEPGSTMKIFTLAAAIEEGVYNGGESYKSGTYSVSKKDKPIKDHNNGNGWGPITFNEGVERSSNVAFAILANEKLGTDRFNQYLRKFHFYDKTGIDLPGEASSKINFEYQRDKVSTAYGQASAVTPIQQLQAATAVANNGKMMKPYVIDHVVDPDSNKTVLQNKPKKVGQPISAKTAKEVRDLLGNVVTSKKGTGRPYQIEGFDVAGKTGTAQIAGPDGKYLTGRENYVFSFMGMAPKNDPELLVYVAVQQPKLKDTETGSEPVSKIFNPVMKNSLHYLNITPSSSKKDDGKEQDEQMTMPDMTDKRTESAVKEAKEEGLDPVTIGDGMAVKDQYPKAGEAVLPNERVFLKTDGNIAMPDMTGWSKRDVLRFGSMAGIHIETNGEGYVTSQSVKKGKKVKTNTVIKVKLKNS
ncbi:penicillin-binding protein [Bacillus sonorensis]|uniref:serine-type D-Ala-D-Ala carboxypeptidase n=2 Tax=Bacillus sonorensis TaxID=119858 RepID=M5P4P5_9BACI|nr:MULTISPECIES: penicillin-binding protein [Bacillus]TWK77974.1 Penicillin-binding protein 2B [Bacillus paralicheniformis]ASB89727.1 Penicillin-binding protein 2B [Bacillus sonorensis]EME74403.1 penicillin-binding protein 2B [Bacillus sonorensis L12]MBG9917017.1 penicillin-binding protein [Bacillus sonorensis]MCF7618980.1 penicillin-binding protein [Bacillus sonorensis]